MSPSPSPRGSSYGLSNLRLRDSSSKPDSHPWTPAMIWTWAPTPISTSASAPALTSTHAPAPGHDLQLGDVDMMGFIQTMRLQKQFLMSFEGFTTIIYFI
ncbi:hypothetical protein K7X08_033701 [Anisodus acutangulus]|uniref:Uncharacterized protein n=1 Tax=Anisodus acutangulus TaxID=402998 RepID=A0A9Q1M755_9SOLA|nr:hypothetical protein K7X08_033701 [Anisodus acutangulus]